MRALLSTAKSHFRGSVATNSRGQLPNCEMLVFRDLLRWMPCCWFRTLRRPREHRGSLTTATGCLPCGLSRSVLPHRRRVHALSSFFVRQILQLALDQLWSPSWWSELLRLCTTRSKAPRLDVAPQNTCCSCSSCCGKHLDELAKFQQSMRQNCFFFRRVTQRLQTLMARAADSASRHRRASTQGRLLAFSVQKLP